MKKTDIKVGKHYVTKFRGNLAVVHIVSENRYGGWDAFNITEGHDIWITTAACFRREATSDEVVIRNVFAFMERAFFIGNDESEDPSGVDK